jgi:hypothetical protein
MGMVPEDGTLHTACFLIPPFKGKIKPPATRVVADFKSGLVFLKFWCESAKALLC